MAHGGILCRPIFARESSQPAGAGVSPRKLICHLPEMAKLD